MGTVQCLCSFSLTPLHDAMSRHLRTQHCSVMLDRVCPKLAWICHHGGRKEEAVPPCSPSHRGSSGLCVEERICKGRGVAGRGAEINGLADQRARPRGAGAAPRARTGAEHLSGKQKATQAEQKRGLFSLKFFFSRSRQRSSRSRIQTLRPYGVRAVREMPNAVTRRQKRGEKKKKKRKKKKSRYEKCRLCCWIGLSRGAAEGAPLRGRGEGGEKDRVATRSRRW